MNRSVDILNELNELSPLLAGLTPVNVYTVPEGYFDAIEPTVLASLGKSENATAEKNDIPEGYFDALAGSILSKIDGTAAHELMEISPFMATIKKDMPFSIPEGYFNNIPETVSEKLEEDVAFLKAAKHIQPFEVPAGYFDMLAEQLLKAVKEEGRTKVISIQSRWKSSLKYAAAAVFTGMITIGVYKFVAKPVQTDPGVLPETAATSLPAFIESGKKMNDQKFNEQLNNLEEATIVKYLEKNASEEDLAVLSSSIDENNLPGQEEYLTDEKTLDDFIKEISTDN